MSLRLVPLDSELCDALSKPEDGGCLASIGRGAHTVSLASKHVSSGGVMLTWTEGGEGWALEARNDAQRGNVRILLCAGGPARFLPPGDSAALAAGDVLDVSIYSKANAENAAAPASAFAFRCVEEASAAPPNAAVPPRNDTQVVCTDDEEKEVVCAEVQPQGAPSLTPHRPEAQREPEGDPLGGAADEPEVPDALTVLPSPAARFFTPQEDAPDALDVDAQPPAAQPALPAVPEEHVQLSDADAPRVAAAAAMEEDDAPLAADAQAQPTPAAAELDAPAPELALPPCGAPGDEVEAAIEPSWDTEIAADEEGDEGDQPAAKKVKLTEESGGEVQAQVAGVEAGLPQSVGLAGDGAEGAPVAPEAAPQAAYDDVIDLTDE